METSAQPQRLEIGGVLGDAWGLYTRFFVRFVTVAAIVFVALGLLEALVGAAARGGWFAAVVWGIFGAIVSLVGYFWVQGALVEAVRDVRSGRADKAVGELFSAVRPRLVPLIVAGVLAAIGIGIGLILLVVPGLFLLTRWVLIIPVIVIEGRSAGEAFGRSSEIVKGNGWKVFGLILVTFVLLLIAGGIIGGIVALVLAFLPSVIVTWVANIVVNSLIAPFVALAWTLTYFRLAGDPAAAAAAAAAPAPEPATGP